MYSVGDTFKDIGGYLHLVKSTNIFYCKEADEFKITYYTEFTNDEGVLDTDEFEDIIPSEGA